MSNIVALTLIIGLFCEAALIAILVWSIFVPDRRLWPPRQVSWLSQIIVWMPTIAVFGSAIIIGLSQWNALGWPFWLRWTIGLPWVLAGNVVVWSAALGIGMDATSGAEAERKRSGSGAEAERKRSG
ncbi:hypothetical protein LGQ03_12430, partial [Loktanella sp. TSTF-M6]|nr:hypothetical protein [Loktanella gaetbuli]